MFHHPSANASPWIIAGSDGWPVWPPSCPEIRQEIEKILQSGQWGAYHASANDRLAEQLTAMHAPGEVNEAGTLTTRLCSSGTAAIDLALRGFGIGGNTSATRDQVVIAAFDYPGNFRTIELLGAQPVLVDVVEDGVTMDPESLRQVESPSVKAVVVSHLFGHLARMPEIAAICRQRGWFLIEDACQVPGARWIDRTGQTEASFPLGTLADAMALSFGGSKPLSAGNGGAILTRNPRLIAKLNQFVDRPSNTYPLSALQAAVLLPQLESLPTLNACRQRGVQKLRSLDWRKWQASPIQAVSAETFPAYYKLALVLDDEVDRQPWLHEFAKSDFLGMGQPPIGAGFRSMHSTNERRSVKPVDLSNSARIDQSLVVVDHRVLLHFGDDSTHT